MFLFKFNTNPLIFVLTMIENINPEEQANL